MQNFNYKNFNNKTIRIKQRYAFVRSWNGEYLTKQDTKLYKPYIKIHGKEDREDTPNINSGYLNGRYWVISIFS